MATRKPAPHDVVAVLRDIPEQEVSAGWVGTVVDRLDEDVYLVEFADAQGRTLLLSTLLGDDLLVLDAMQAKLIPI